MLLGSTGSSNTPPATEEFIIQLISQQRYAEVYALLGNQKLMQTSAQYNLALCLHWAGSYNEALSQLDNIRLAPQLSSSDQYQTDTTYKLIKSKQSQTKDYLQGISEVYVQNFPALVQDAIVRLKTDCWLQLGNYAKVIAIATPIVHKGYNDIADALKLAEASKA
jgi:hypothetical protein